MSAIHTLTSHLGDLEAQSQAAATPDRGVHGDA